MTEFSTYKSEKGIKQVKPTGRIDLKSCMQILRTDKELKTATAKVRAAKTPELRKKEKEKLPYATFSGVFTSRANDKIKERSEYFCIDIDHIGNADAIHVVKNEIRKYITPGLMFISPSGDGLKVVLQIDPNAGTHHQFYFALEYFIKKVTGRDIDEQCKDISRACFLCHDPEAVYEETPSVLSQKFITEFTPKGLPVINKEETEVLPKAVNEELEYKNARKDTDKKLTFTPGHRNEYIVALSDTCNRFGISETFVLSQISEFIQSDFPLEDIESVVRSRYNHTEWHAKAKKEKPKTDKCPYIRVGTDYFKVIIKRNRYGILQRELKRWTKDALVTDFGKDYLKPIPKFDDFCMVPDYVDYQSIINNQYNMFSPPCHNPAPGQWPWTKILLEQIFGDQYELGIRYMQILYCYPQWSTVILVIVSSKQKTGKTTFVNWLSMIFGSNSAVISSMDFQSMFNGHYATKNVVMIEETLFDKKLTIEKLKALTTQKQLSVNRKNIDQFNLEFFGKVILTSNYEDKFASINNEETRFFVRKLEEPKIKNITIEQDLLSEIPAFLHYLQKLPPLSEKVDRSGFTSAELRNCFLDAVKAESIHEISKELTNYITDYFDNNESIEEFFASAIDLKLKFFPNDYRTGTSWLMRILKEDFRKLPADRVQRYTPFEQSLATNKTGRPYNFKRSEYVTK